MVTPRCVSVLAVEAVHAVECVNFLTTFTIYGIPRILPGHCERGHDFIANLNRMDIFSRSYYRTGELVAHDESGVRGLVASESMKFAKGGCEY